MHVGFIGLGLIGGSIARAIRANPQSSTWTMSAWSPTGRGPGRAAADRVIDRVAATPEDAVADADLVVLAGPPTACLVALDDLAVGWRHRLSPSTVITDVASTKVALVERADDAGLRFVGGHPMAGLEVTGFDAGRADLFVGRPWVIVPGRVADAADVGRVTTLAEQCGAAPMRMDAATHDRAVAGVSHLPLLLAAALVETVAGRQPGTAPEEWPIAAELAATGWRDMTRLARGDPAMGAGIAVTNAAALAERLRDLQGVLKAWLVELERPGGPDETAIAEHLDSVRARLDERHG